MPEIDRIKVFLLDDREVVRRGVHERLSGDDDIDVVGEAGTAADALVRIPVARPDVAVLDVRLPDGSGVEVRREVRSRYPKIARLMLTSIADDEAFFDAIMTGAAGCVLKAIRGSDLLTVVRDVAAGRSLLDPVATARVLERLRRGDEKGHARLENVTEQERTPAHRSGVTRVGRRRSWHGVIGTGHSVIVGDLPFSGWSPAVRQRRRLPSARSAHC